MSDAFDERLARTRGDVAERAAAEEQARTERQQASERARAAAAETARALLPELLASIEALRDFEEADPARTSRWKVERINIDLGFFPDSAPITFSREYRPSGWFGKGAELKGWIITSSHGGLTLTIPRSRNEPLVVHPFPTLEEVANAGMYSATGRVVVAGEAFDAVIQTIAEHIARGHAPEPPSVRRGPSSNSSF